MLLTSMHDISVCVLTNSINLMCKSCDFQIRMRTVSIEF